MPQQQNHLVLPSFNLKQFSLILILLLVNTVTSTTTPIPSTTEIATPLYECPTSCICNETELSARCNSLDGLISSLNSKAARRHNYMPIQLLDLSNNELTKLTNQMELLVNLTELNLSNNQLTQVHKLKFKHLEKLDLSHNQITSAKLTKIPVNIVHLNLSFNEITYIPLGFMKLKKLRSIELNGNPLNCTCSTLHVRNWMSYRSIWSDQHIKCIAPLNVKDQPWLQAKQHEICNHEMQFEQTTKSGSKYNWDNYDDENELMMGDEAAGSGENIDNSNSSNDPDYDNTEEEIFDEDTKKKEDNDEGVKEEIIDDSGNIEEQKADEDNAYDDNADEESVENDDDFIPVGPVSSSTIEPITVSTHISMLGSEIEGSADGVEIAINSTDESDDDGSGSGFGALPHVPHFHVVPEDDDQEDDLNITVPPLTIFQDVTTEKLAIVVTHRMTENIGETIGDQNSAITAGAGNDENQGTYILLAILAIGLLSLVIFVAMKNRRSKKRNRLDLEKNATELLDMDKKLLGKPIDRNGNGRTENAPLMSDYPKNGQHEKPTAYTSFHPPAITVDEPVREKSPNQKSQQSLYENVPNGNGDVEPIHRNNYPQNGSAPKPVDEDDVFLPVTDEPRSLEVSPLPAKRYSPIYNPASPRSDRYSPVYSPETGRVKIKLVETPKPKTPIVVTRSRSRAGDSYEITPN
ncbi:unnamed protein product [Diamesa serratosioi]